VSKRVYLAIVYYPWEGHSVDEYKTLEEAREWLRRCSGENKRIYRAYPELLTDTKGDTK
jgi:hypothetical protein